MKTLPYRAQSGFALLIFVVLLMGIGGFVLVGFGQSLLEQVDEKKFLHNQRVLNEAKQALLQFAYNYPVTNGNGPGRLPCADTDNDGIPNTAGACALLGRVPWLQANLNLPDLRDADGQRLWYAVSNNFDTNTGGVAINSDTVGSITIRDQSGNVIFDGSTNGGVAAVIIAPGAITGRNDVAQDRAVTNGIDDPFDALLDTDSAIINPVNYLDLLVGVEDNADFVHDSATNGFILGPVNSETNNAVNDQIILITAAEVVEMAEKAVLQAYRNALEAYDLRIDTDLGVAGNYYPWLYNFAVNDYGGGYPELDEYPSDLVFFNSDAPVNSELERYLGNNGRIPSIFTDYFTETDGQPIESHLGINLTLTYPISPSPVGFNQTVSAVCPSNPAINCLSGNLDFDTASNHVINQTSTDPLTAVTFEDIDPNVFSANDGGLTATVVTSDTFSDVKFFWDEKPTGDGWVECGDDGDLIPQFYDCDRNGAGVPDPGGGNITPSQVLRVQVDVNLTGNIRFDMNYGAAPTALVDNAADGTQHANITGTFDGINLDDTTLPITVTYIYDDNYAASFDPEATGTLSLADLLQGGASLALTLRYYPELPAWASSNRDGWHDSIIMAYANNLRPDIPPGGACTEADPLPANRCLTVNNMGGNIDDKISLLVIGGQHNWIDEGADGLANDVIDIFDLENEDLDDTFDVRAANANDKILVIN